VFRRKRSPAAYGLGFPAAWSGSPSPVRTPRPRIYPIQSISYEFGSKSMSGYFVERQARHMPRHAHDHRAERTGKVPLPPVTNACSFWCCPQGRFAGPRQRGGASRSISTCGEDAKDACSWTAGEKAKPRGHSNLLRSRRNVAKFGVGIGPAQIAVTAGAVGSSNFGRSSHR